MQREMRVASSTGSPTKWQWLRQNPGIKTQSPKSHDALFMFAVRIGRLYKKNFTGRVTLSLFQALGGWGRAKKMANERKKRSCFLFASPQLPRAWPLPYNRFNGIIDIFQGLEWKPPSLSQHFLLPSDLQICWGWPDKGSGYLQIR